MIYPFDYNITPIMNRQTIWYDALNKQQQVIQYDDRVEITAWYPNGKVFFEVIGKYYTHIIKQFNDEQGNSLILPDGPITVWKACRTKNRTDVYVQLRVPENAKRVTPLSNKYKARVEFAEVVDIVDEKGKHYKEAVSFISKAKIKYIVGQTVRADRFNDSLFQECTHGIHVHLHKQHCDQWFLTDINQPLTKYYRLIDNYHRILSGNFTLLTFDGILHNTQNNSRGAERSEH